MEVLGSQIAEQPHLVDLDFDHVFYKMITVPVRIVDPSKDLNSYGLGSVDWKERVEGWKLKQEKNMMQMTNKYNDVKGDMEGTGSNGEDLQM